MQEHPSEHLNASHSHGLHGVVNELYPGVALFLRADQDLHHLRLLSACRDEEEAALFVGDLPDDQLLEGQDRGALVLRGQGDHLMKRMWEESRSRKRKYSGRVKMRRGWKKQEGGWVVAQENKKGGDNYW